MKGFYVMLRLGRLKGFGWTELLVLHLAHRVCGTPLYFYPKRERERLRQEQDYAGANLLHGMTVHISPPSLRVVR